MTRLTSRSRLAAAVSPIAFTLALAAGSGPAWAQDTATATEAEQAAQQAAEDAAKAAQDAEAAQDEAAQTQSIVVTGFRAALQNATSTKKRSDQIVESVSAEDIGKLPDNSIAESIARLPGLAAQRNQGRATIISIRGFGPDFSVTTLNGREQTTTNDSRSVEFDQFPSEVISQVLVYKSPAADLAPQGLVGTVDLRTIRPLDAGKRVIAVGARGTYVDQDLMPDAKNKGWRVFGTYVDQFADGNLGVALSAAYTSEPYQTKDWQAWDYVPLDADTYRIHGVKMWYEASTLKRLGLNGTVQARVSDTISMTWDAFYSNFKDHVDQRGFEWEGNGLVPGESENGLLTSGSFVGIDPIVEGYAVDRDADLYSLGWNTRWDNHNGWKGMADLSWSRTNRDDHNLETTAGPSFNHGGPHVDINFDWTNHGPEFSVNGPVDFGDPNQLVLTDTQGWGWTRVQAGYDKLRRTKDDLKQARAEIERELGSFVESVKLGVSYTDRSKTLDVTEAFLLPGGTGTCTTPSGGVVNNPCSVPIPTDAIVGTVNFMRGIGPLLLWDPRGLVGDGILVREENDTTGIAKKEYKVTEKVWAPYIMARLNGSLGSADLTGNVGLQAVHTSQASEGLIFPNGVPTDSRVGTKYWTWLPSLNLALRFPSDFVVRFGASRQMMRARLPDMNNAIDYHVDTTRGNVIVGDGGNPYLKPYTANAVDLTLEKYFASKGYIALQAFFKHLDSYIAKGEIPFDYSGLPPTTGIPPVSLDGFLTTYSNTKGGNLYGIELAGTLPFEVFSPSLDGFGVTGGLGYTKTRVRDFDGSIAEIPGYSKWVGNLTAFYEEAGFNARGSMRYRSKFRGEFRSFEGSPSPQTVLAETIFDAQVGYDFPEASRFRGLSLYLQGQNLTDERSATVQDNASTNDTAFLRWQTFGRRFVAGFTYKFGAEAPAAAPLPPPPPPPPAPPPATQTCGDGSVILATEACPVPPPPPPPPPPPAPERG